MQVKIYTPDLKLALVDVSFAKMNDLQNTDKIYVRMFKTLHSADSGNCTI